MTKSILITGAAGQVGQELMLVQTPNRMIPLTHGQLDITIPDQIEAGFDAHKPDLVINSAAYTQVDLAEADAELVMLTNRDGVANLARACATRDIPLMHVSTDYVFDGEKQGNYIESDPVGPLNVYGQSKAEGDAALASILPKHILIRSSWIFGVLGSSNFVKTMLRLGKERDVLGIIDDQHGCPTSARSLARVLIHIADRYLAGDDIEWGLFNFSNQPATTWYGFAKAIFSQAGGYENLKLNAIETSDYPTPAKRPRYSVLDCSRIKQVYDIDRENWADELQLMLDQLQGIEEGKKNAAI